MEKYRTFSPRFFAQLIDGIIFITIYYFYELILMVPEMPVSIIIAGLIISDFCYFFYSIYLHSVYGQTLGKMALKIKVLDISENPIKLHQAFLRDAPNILSTIPFLAFDIYQISTAGLIDESLRDNQLDYTALTIVSVWLIAEIIVTLSNKKRRAIHDFIAGTVVVRTNH